MSYSERWQELFGPIDGGPAMNLASTAPEPGNGGGGGGGNVDLKHSKGPWTSASNTAGDLRTNTETSRSALGPGHEGLASGAAGLSSAAALKSVLTSWEERLQSVRDECEQLKGTLLKVAKEMGETETAIKTSFKGVDGGSKADEKR
ncbi:hypothetical protein ACFCYM_14825 [Streptomyces sp. NPDC056254]|uniref:hypothetical protein n=1 Tax=unclassified Streptomyces TaxID=2593676 RepID=UPI0004AAD3E4|nr:MULTISPECIES: hypothetical protein [unclassified Streptomyces]APU38695.1 hypothetical protein BSL84_01825 [Streptomyces sp. TN58]KJK44929.1 hypothetical protein UK14_27370 [Streptomyces sp. NRRL F-4428]